MRLGLAIAAFGVAVAASGGSAYAQSTLAERSATAAEVPWYERFTYSSSGAEQIPAWSTINPRAPNAPVAGARWGFTVNVGEEERVRVTEGVAPKGEAAVGAFYRFSPRVRVGGQVSVAPQPVPGVARGRQEADENTPGVKLESAFRF